MKAIREKHFDQELDELLKAIHQLKKRATDNLAQSTSQKRKAEVKK